MKPLVAAVAVLVALAAGASVQAQVGESFDGSVVGITDGDTISVLRDGEQVRVRVEGIDTPESDQAFGAQASAFTSSLLRNKRVAVHVRDVARHELASVVEDYRQGLIPFIVPLTLIRHHARRLEVSYLLGQSYFDPELKELMLRNHA